MIATEGSHGPAPGAGADRAADPLTSLLIEAGVAVAESLDLGETLSRVAGLAVPALGDICVIDLLDADGAVRRAAVASADARLAARVESQRERESIDAAADHPVAAVIRSGQPLLLAEMSPEFLRSVAFGDTHARAIVELGYRSAVIVPLRARQRTLGALSVVRLAAGEPYTRADLGVVGELGRRAALAIDNARLFAEAQRVERQLAAILVTLAEAITLTDASDTIVFANHAAAKLLGADSAQELLRRNQESAFARFRLLSEDGRPLAPELMPRRRLFADGGSAEPLMMRAVERASGRERWLLARPAPVRDPDTDELQFAVNVYEDVTALKRLQVTESFMAEASRMLASSNDYVGVLGRVARLAVPQLAAWCAFDVLNEDGRIERVAVHHGDPAKLALLRRVRTAYPRHVDDRAGLTAQVARTGEPVLIGAVTHETLRRTARDRRHMEMQRAVGATSAMIVPLAAPTRTVGTLTLAIEDPVLRYTEDDLALAVRLGRRAGTAVEAARINAERTRIASILQESLLPESLPEIDGLQMQVLYHAAGELNDVGGDFYDVIPYRRGRWLLVIGDVCGKGPRAAGVTALARHTLKTAAMLGQQPGEMLGTLHRALREQPPGADLCTVCIVMVEPHEGSASLTVTLAGHPPPLLLEADGRVRPLGVPGTLLGVLDPLDSREVPAELLAGQTLLMYTDGLPEAGSPAGQLGEHGLERVYGEANGLTLTRMLASIERAAIEHADGPLRDDIALIGLRLADPLG